jgi:ribosomal protein S18 acetylase RimI-like enzyme
MADKPTLKSKTNSNDEAAAFPAAVTQALADFVTRSGSAGGAVTVSAPDIWHVDARFRLADGRYRVRNLAAGDEAALAAFGRQLGARARDLFSPYPWDDETRCRAAFTQAVAQSVRRIDAAYLLEHEGNPIGHFFLWRAAGNPLSQRVGLEVPELGVAVADACQGRGFGSLAVRLLQAVAKVAGADAIELTTAADNEAGWRVYQRAGFDYTGMLKTPLDVDVTAAQLGLVAATRFRLERQMVWLASPARREAVLKYLAAKRAEA